MSDGKLVRLVSSLFSADFGRGELLSTVPTLGTVGFLLSFWVYAGGREKKVMDGAAQIVVLVPAIAVAYVRYLQRLGIVDQNIKIVLSPEEDMLTTEVEE